MRRTATTVSEEQTVSCPKEVQREVRALALRRYLDQDDQIGKGSNNEERSQSLVNVCEVYKEETYNQSGCVCEKEKEG